jgi:cephalosporin hydroxylase
LFLIYRISHLPDARRAAQVWRREAARHGIAELHLCAVESSQFATPAEFGCDSAVEFPPHGIHAKNYAPDIQQQNRDFTGVVMDYRKVAQYAISRADPGYRLFRGVCTSWDNSPRTGNRGRVFTHSSPREYELWLHAAADYTCQHQPPNDRLLFVNAWNEWAEGAHLEPDQRYGRQFLEATRRVVEGQRDWRGLPSTLNGAHGLPPEKTAEPLDELGLFLEGKDRSSENLSGPVRAASDQNPSSTVAFLDQAIVPGFKMPSEVAGKIVLDSIPPRGLTNAAVLSRGNPVTFHGWAFVEGRALKRYSGLILVLADRELGKRFFAHVPRRRERPDVSAAFPEVETACTYWSGFDVEIDLDGIPAGIYDLGIIQLKEGDGAKTDLLPPSEGSVVAFFPFQVKIPGRQEATQPGMTEAGPWKGPTKWKQWLRSWLGTRPALDRMVWLKDRMLLDDLVFRLEHFKSDAWELGEECFRFYKVQSLVDALASFWETRKDFDARHVVELGIWDGGSLAFWNEVLRPNKLVGIDVADRANSEYFQRYLGSRGLHDRIKTYWRTDQRDGERLQQIVSAEFAGPLDLIIDDASHTYHATKASFETLFPLLRPGGLYIIEDWAWGHWPEHNGPTHSFANETEPTRLIEELVHAIGSSFRVPRQFVSRMTVHEGFAVVVRGPQALPEGLEFRLEDYIIRRPTSRGKPRHFSNEVEGGEAVPIGFANASASDGNSPE